MGDVCVMVVFYPGCEVFLDEYTHSLKSQSQSDFHLLVVSDGLKEGVCRKALNKAGLFDYEILTTQRPTTIAKNREFGLISAARRGFEKIVLTDADDIYMDSRIMDISDALKTRPFVVNDIQVRKGKTVHNVLEENRVPPQIPSKLLLRSNMAGFGNSGIRGEIIQDIVPIPEHIIAVDWWIATVSSILHGDLSFLRKPLTTYRQHPGNLIGMSEGTHPRKVRKGIAAKRIHYRNLADNPRIPEHYRILFKSLEKETVLLEKFINHENRMEGYVETVNKFFQGRLPLWWEDIMPLEQLGMPL